MKAIILRIMILLFVFNVISCKKENPNNNQSAQYQIDSIVFSMYDTAGVAFYNYPFIPNNDAVFASVNRNNDTITYISKYYADIEPFNSNSTVQVKGNRIFKSSYIVPFGIFGQDGGTTHEYYYYNSNNKIDSVVHISYGEFDLIPFDTTYETYYFIYENNNLTRTLLNGIGDSVSVHYSSYLNQKDLIGIDVNELLGLGLIIHTNNSESYFYGVADDIFEFQKNCIINNFNSANTNSKYLIEKISSDASLTYGFDAAKSNRVKDITVFNEGKKRYFYKFYYAN